MVSLPRADWVVVTEDHLACRRCGERLKIPLPAHVSTLSAMAQAFTAAHANCKERPSMGTPVEAGRGSETYPATPPKRL